MNKQSTMDGNLHSATEVAASALATKSTYAGSLATIGGWLMQSEFIAAAGLLLALLGFVVNLIFKIREDRRQQEAHKAAMESARHVAAANDKLDHIAEAVKSNNQPEFGPTQGYGGYQSPAKK